MKAYEFDLKLNEQGTIELPPRVKVALEAGGDAKLILLLEEAEGEDRAWAQLAAESFFADDDPANDIYYQHYLESKREKVNV